MKWGPHGTRSKTSDHYWKEPLRWDREAATAMQAWVESHRGSPADCGPPPHRPRVFCASLADVFEDWQGPIVNASGERLSRNAEGRYTLQGHPEPWATMADLRRDLFALIDRTPNLDWVILTKRPENIRRMWIPPSDFNPKRYDPPYYQEGVPPKFRGNVWLLTSVSNQQTADRMIPELLRCRDLVPVLGISAEPLLGPLDLYRWIGLLPADVYLECARHIATGQDNEPDPGPALDWIVVGGESGPHARPMNIAWARSLVEQSQAGNVPCFFKQLGAKCLVDIEGTEDGFPEGTRADVIGRFSPVVLRDPKGGDPSEWPEDLRVRQFPQHHLVEARR